MEIRKYIANFAIFDIHSLGASVGFPTGQNKRSVAYQTKALL